MFEDHDIEDVEQSENNDRDLIAADPEGVDSDKPAVGEGWDVEGLVDDLPPLPTEEEAEMGELCRTPKGSTDEEVRVMVEALEEGGAF
jgi:hypothetical protein